MSEEDGLRVVKRAYVLIEKSNGSFICIAIVEAADMLELADRKNDFDHEIIN